MRVRLFTLRYSESLGGFDGRPLDDFTRHVELIAFREHFFLVNDVPHVLCVVTWQSPALSNGGDNDEPEPAGLDGPLRAPARRRSRKREDPVATLDEPGRALFQTLRAWRAERARAEGVPPYIVFNNRELVEVIRRRPDNPTALGNVPGIGTGKVERYGTALLEVLASAEGEASP